MPSKKSVIAYLIVQAVYLTAKTICLGVSKLSAFISRLVCLILALHYTRTTTKKEIVKNLAKKWQTANQSLYTIHS